MRTPALLVAAALVLTACASKSPSAPAASGSSAPTTSSPAPSTTRFVIPTPVLAVDPCKLTDAQVSAVVGFGVKKKSQNIAGHCEYAHDPGGSVSFSVDAGTGEEEPRAKADENFSLGGRYITITDESGFAHDAFTAVKNPGNQSPGVIADFWAYLSPGHFKLRIYYPSGGKEPGRQHALRLAHMMLG
jgi:hypothetical protein